MNNKLPPACQSSKSFYEIFNHFMKLHRGVKDTLETEKIR